MFHITHQRKPRQRRVAVLCTLLLLLFSFTLPASASPPQDLSFTFDVTYAPIPTDQGVGAWSSAGVLAGAGDVAETYVVGGFDNCWKTIHTTSVLTGPTPADTITVRMQVVRIEAGPPLSPPFPPSVRNHDSRGQLDHPVRYGGLRRPARPGTGDDLDRLPAGPGLP